MRASMPDRTPGPAEIVTMFETLFSRRTKVKAIGKARVGARSYLGVYRDNEDEVHGVCVFDPLLALSLAGALSMVPPVALAETKKAPQLPEFFVENLHEVFNVCVCFFARYSDVSMRLRDVIHTGARIPMDVAACVAASKRCDFFVTVPGYGGGRMTLFLVGR